MVVVRGSRWFKRDRERRIERDFYGEEIGQEKREGKGKLGAGRGV